MGLFSFLKFKRKDKETLPAFGLNEYVPSFWDDDYCQIEIVPKDNKDFILKQVFEIDDFSEASKSEFGFTSIFVRGEMPTTTLSKEIRFDYLENTLLNFNFEKAKRIYFDGRQVLDCEAVQIKAFGFSNFTIFFDIEKEFVKNIWLHEAPIVSVTQFELIKNVLYTLGEECGLVLINWNASKLYDLSDRNEIQDYLIANFK